MTSKFDNLLSLEMAVRVIDKAFDAVNAVYVAMLEAKMLPDGYEEGITASLEKVREAVNDLLAAVDAV